MSHPSHPVARAVLRWIMAAFYVAAGWLHVTYPEKFLPIVPGWVPLPLDVVIATGWCEIAGAAGLLIPRLRWTAGLMLALYEVCVFPANVKHALEGVDVPGLPSSWWYHGPRLLAQPALAWWALWCGEVVDWPWGKP